MDPLAEFVELVTGPLADVHLDRACLLVAAVLTGQDGEVDIAHELSRLDELAAGVAEHTLEGVVRHLFASEGFEGDRADYYDVENSLLPRVLDRRRGIPITLAVVTIEVARRVGVALVGIGLPGHFLVGDVGDRDRFVDAFSGGVLLDGAACRRLFEHLHGPAVPFEDRYLDPVGPLAIMARVLGNLKQITTVNQRRHELALVLKMRSAIPGIGPQERTELAEALVAIGRFDSAAAELESLAEQSAEADAELLRRAANKARARLN